MDKQTFKPKPGDKWVSTTKGLMSYFAVVYWVNNEDAEIGPFVEPWDTGGGRYATRDEAIEEAQYLAEFLELPYVAEGTKCAMPSLG